MEKDIHFVARFYREGKLNTSQAWKKLGIQADKNPSWFVYCTIAASICLLAGFGWWGRFYDRQEWVNISAAPDTAKEIILPDNTHITLGANATLCYDRLAYNKKERKVALNGKAFFIVRAMQERPFKVQTQLADVQVLGTRFQVIAHADSTSASVESGKVAFSNRTEKETILTARMKAAAYPDGRIKVSEEKNPNAFAWSTREFVYNDTPLSIVINDLEEAYHIRIGNRPGKELRLTVSFHQNSIDEILKVINQTLNTDLTKQ